MPLNINFQQILLHMFNFVILAFGLYMLLYKPVVAFMKKREDHFADLEKQAQEAKSQAEATLAEYNAKLAGADEEIRQKNAAAAQEADRQRQERMQRAQADADKLLKNARGAAEQERNAMLEGAKKDIAQMVVSATGTARARRRWPSQRSMPRCRWKRSSSWPCAAWQAGGKQCRTIPRCTAQK